MSYQRKWVACGMGFAAITLGFVACGRILATDAYTALQIAQVQVLSGGDCSVPGTATSLHRTGGTLDLDLPDRSLPPYFLPLLVVNNLDAVGGSKATEMNNITLTHFTVELSAPGVTWSSSCPAKFDTQSFTDTIPPGGSAGAALNIITSAHSQCLLPQVPPQQLVVTAKIWAKGRHGGMSIESAPFVYSVDVCLGCLQMAYTDPALVPYRYNADYPLCASLTGANPYTGDPCFAPGQDQTIFCCGITQTVNGATKDVALCPGVFSGKTGTDTSTSTATTP